jgi:hypothetical protein
MTRAILFIILGAAACGVSKEYVRQQTRAEFDNTVSAATHVKLKCGGQAGTDEDCRQASDKLTQTCQSLDELSKQADAKGFDCAAWTVRQ